VGEHVIDGDQDFMRDCHGRAFVPTSVKLVAQIGSLDRGCCMGPFKYTLPLGMRLFLRLPADSLLPGQTPAQEASCETLWNTLMSTPSSAMMTAAKVQSTPGISSNKASCAA